jgi:hypothetical protein
VSQIALPPARKTSASTNFSNFPESNEYKVQQEPFDSNVLEPPTIIPGLVANLSENADSFCNYLFFWNQFGQSEIHDFSLVSFGYKNIGRFNISMDDAF